MSEEDIARRLAEAFAAQARAQVDDFSSPPPLRLDRPVPSRRHRAAKILAPLAAAAVIAGVAVGIAVHQSTPGSDHVAAGQGTSSTISASPSTHRPTTPAPTSAPTTSGAPTSPATVVASPVHLSLQLSGGTQVGVGMPVIAYLSKTITDGRALQQATKVTVNGAPVDAQWYFAPLSDRQGEPMQAHLRMATYWPAHAQIAITVAAKGLSAGNGLVYDDDLALDLATGPANIATVDDKSHTLTLVSDGVKVGAFPVSLGASASPTEHGTKVVMEKGVNICMKGPGYDECDIKYTQRLTYSGEYLHAAPWNVANIKAGIDSSNGCTNLLPGDAQRLYGIMEIGDVVNYPNADGPHMTFGDGYGDWNVAWATWITGGAVPTH